MEELYGFNNNQSDNEEDSAHFTDGYTSALHSITPQYPYSHETQQFQSAASVPVTNIFNQQDRHAHGLPTDGPDLVGENNIALANQCNENRLSLMQTEDRIYQVNSALYGEDSPSKQTYKQTMINVSMLMDTVIQQQTTLHKLLEQKVRHVDKEMVNYKVALAKIDTLEQRNKELQQEVKECKQQNQQLLNKIMDKLNRLPKAEVTAVTAMPTLKKRPLEKAVVEEEPKKPTLSPTSTTSPKPKKQKTVPEKQEEPAPAKPKKQKTVTVVESVPEKQEELAPAKKVKPQPVKSRRRVPTSGANVVALFK